MFTILLSSRCFIHSEKGPHEILITTASNSENDKNNRFWMYIDISEINQMVSSEVEKMVMLRVTLTLSNPVPSETRKALKRTQKKRTLMHYLTLSFPVLVFLLTVDTKIHSPIPITVIIKHHAVH